MESFDISDPRSFNRYSYVMNNPMVFVDPDGAIAFKAIKSVVKFAVKGGDLGLTFSGVIEDFNTLTDSNASGGARALAGFSLVTEAISPLSLRDAKSGIGIAKGALEGTGLLSRLKRVGLKKLDTIGTAGRRGRDETIREVTGDFRDAGDLTDAIVNLGGGAKSISPKPGRVEIGLGDGGVVNLRKPSRKSPNVLATIDTDTVPGTRTTKIKIKPDQ